MLGLKLQHGFEGGNGILDMPGLFLRESKLKVQGREGGIDFLGLLESLNRLVWLVCVQIRQAHEVIRSPTVLVQTERLLALFDCSLIVAGQQESIGEVQMGIDAFRRQGYCLAVERDGIGGVLTFEVTVASRHQAGKRILMRSFAKQKDTSDHNDGQPNHNPYYGLWHLGHRKCMDWSGPFRPARNSGRGPSGQCSR